MIVEFYKFIGSLLEVGNANDLEHTLDSSKCLT